MTYDQWKTDSGYDERDPEEDEGEAWEYWHGRAMAAEAALHEIRKLEPGTQEWVDGKPIDAAGVLADVFMIARSVGTDKRNG